MKTFAIDFSKARGRLAGWTSPRKGCYVKGRAVANVCQGLLCIHLIPDYPNPKMKIVGKVASLSDAIVASAAGEHSRYEASIIARVILKTSGGDFEKAMHRARNPVQERGYRTW